MDNRYWENLNQENSGAPQNTGDYSHYTHQPIYPAYTELPEQPQPRVPAAKKKRKPAGRGFLVFIVAVCMLVSVAGGYVGSLLAASDGGSSDQTAPDESGVLYQSVDRVTDSTGNQSSSFADIAKLASPSVVEVTTEEASGGYFFQQYVTTGAGSGVIISTDGYIVTCAHVVDGASSVKIRLSDGTEYPAEIVGTPDTKSDLALLKIDASGLTPAVIGDSDALAVGEDAIVIGNPLGSLGGTVTNGIISALGREVTVENQTMTLLQTNAAVNPGNSGGGIFNMKGELIGIVNAKSYGEDIEGLGFAIPSNDMKGVVEQLMEIGYVSTPSLGITALWVSDQQTAAEYGYERFGVYIHEVVPGKGAEAAGLQPRDYILSINGTIVDATSDISAILGEHSIGDTVEVQVIRDGQTLTFSVELTELNA